MRLRPTPIVLTAFLALAAACGSSSTKVAGTPAASATTVATSAAAGGGYAVPPTTTAATTATTASAYGDAYGGATTSPPTTAEATVTSSPGASGAAVTVITTTKGSALGDAQGRALYLFTPDNAGKPTCTGACAAKWPPAGAPSSPVPGPGVDAAKLATATHPEAGPQLSYNGHPLYLFSGDAKPGDTNGEGLGGIWYLVSPAGDPLR